VLGAGGATRGAIEPLLAEAPAQLFIANRTATKAHELVELFTPLAPQGTQLKGGGYNELPTAFDVVINATSASLGGEALPIQDHIFAPQALAYDMMYGKGLTPFLRLAQQAQVPQLADGVGMLVEQAAEAFAWWRGVRPPTHDMIARIAVPLN
jgi:shikimate dehydrogenase